jgi:hypothetical protein
MSMPTPRSNNRRDAVRNGYWRQCEQRRTHRHRHRRQRRKNMSNPSISRGRLARGDRLWR